MTEIPKDESTMTPRFPCFETIFGPTSYIQECKVECTDAKGIKHTYLLAVTYDSNATMSGNSCWSWAISFVRVREV